TRGDERYGKHLGLVTAVTAVITVTVIGRNEDRVARKIEGADHAADHAVRFQSRSLIVGGRAMLVSGMIDRVVHDERQVGPRGHRLRERLVIASAAEPGAPEQPSKRRCKPRLVGPDGCGA